MNKSFLGYFLAVITIFIWGITFVCTKSLLVEFSAFEILVFRFLIAYIGLWFLHPKWEKIQLKDNIWFALAGLTGIVIYQFSENVAINFTTASNVSVIVSICPMFTAIISQIFLKEKHITFWFVLGFIISIFGVSLVSLNGKLNLSVNPKGDMLAMLASISWGFYSLCISVINKKPYHLITRTRRAFFFALVFMIPLVIIGALTPESSVVHFNFSPSINAKRFSHPLSWINLLFLGLMASSFCFAAWNKVCDSIGTVKATVGIYMIPIVTIVFAYFTLGEQITLMGGIGSILTICGLFISGIKKNLFHKKS